MVLPRLARLLLRLGGWTVINGPPDVRRAVIIGAPHTSNWDGFWALVYTLAVGLEVKFFIKESMFWFPLSIVLSRLGGVPLNRANAGKAVDEAIDLINGSERFFFGLAPEGTRSRTPGWKSGFYRIAEGANVPVVFGFFCYTTRRIGLGPMMMLTGDVDADMAVIRSFYSSVEGRYPEKASPITLAPRRKSNG